MGERERGVVPEATPRIWVPGTCVLEGKRLRLGPNVGWHLRRGIGDWKGGAVVFEKSHRPGPAPETRIDPNTYPRLHAVAKRCSVVATAIEDDIDDDPKSNRHLVVLWHRVSGGGLIEMRGGGEATFGFSGELPGRLRLLGEGFTEQDYEDQYGDFDVHSDITIDRVIRAVSDGVFDEASVELALGLDDASRSAASMQAWESWLVSVEERALEQRAAAEEMASILGRAREKGLSEAELPLYGTVKAELRPEVLMARDDSSDLGPDAIRLPPDMTFSVLEQVEFEWPPSMQRERASAPSRRFNLTMFLVVAAALAVLVAVLLSQ